MGLRFYGESFRTLEEAQNRARQIGSAVKILKEDEERYTIIYVG